MRKSAKPRKQKEVLSDASGQLVIDLGAERERRKAFPAELPVPPEEANQVPYAKANVENYDAGELVAYLAARPEWLETVGAECDVVESERPTHGPKKSYSTLELELFNFFMMADGHRTVRAGRNALAGDRAHRARVALGFDDLDRNDPCPLVRVTRPGVPSEGTMSRHNDRFPPERRVAFYRDYFDRLRRLNAQDPILREGMRRLGIDGTAQPTSLTCPIFHYDTGELVNGDAVTCPDGGYVGGKDQPSHKHGHGYAAVPLVCARELPWAYLHGRINLDERSAAIEVLHDFRDNVLMYAAPVDGLGVVTADSGFHSTGVRDAIRDMGYVDCIHDTSGAKYRPSTDREQAAAAVREFDIAGKPNWYADGFRQLHCRCGHGTVAKKMGTNQDGRTYVRAVGECDRCGGCTITSGKWKAVRDTTRSTGDPRGQQKMVQWDAAADPLDRRDMAFGNPLTFTDKAAIEYGKDRFGFGEGFNGTCVTRWKLFKTKAWLRTQAKAELQTLMVFCLMHGETDRQRSLGAGEWATRPALALAA